jgi:hypothetical protein
MSSLVHSSSWLERNSGVGGHGPPPAAARKSSVEQGIRTIKREASLAISVATAPRSASSELQAAIVSSAHSGWP